MPKNSPDQHGSARRTADLNPFVALLDYPMYVVTTTSDDRYAGCLVGFATQAGINPPRFLVCLSVENFTFTVAAHASHLAVHAIPRDNLALAKLFGEETGTEVDKFSWCKWHRGAHGLPILDDAAAWFVGEIVDRVDAGDHHAFLLAPVEVRAHTATKIVTSADVGNFEAGHEP